MSEAFDEDVALDRLLGELHAFAHATGCLAGDDVIRHFEARSALRIARHERELRKPTGRKLWGPEL